MDNVTCDRFYSRFNRTRVFELGGDPRGSGYEGIPENLLLNAIGLLVFLVLFAILRRVAWDYGRMALVSRKEGRWTELFYGGSDVGSTAPGGDGSSQYCGSQISMDGHVDPHDKTLSWIVAVFKLRDEHYRKKHGSDVVQYLRLQRYLMLYMGIIAVVSLAVALPVNLAGTHEVGRLFARSTISNLDSDSPALWTHSILALLYLVLAVLLMRRYSNVVTLDIDVRDVSRTVMISGLPRSARDAAKLTQHFEEAYSGAAVTAVTFAHFSKNLIDLDTRRLRAAEGRASAAESMKGSDGVNQAIVPYFCGRLCCCCCCQSCGIGKVDALAYYTEQEEKLSKACEAERARTLADGPIGIAFVTLGDEETAQRIYMDYQKKPCKRKEPKQSSGSHDFRLSLWSVQYVQHREDVIWENLTPRPRLWWLKAAAINAVVVICLFFLTTPSVLLTTIDDGKEEGNVTDGVTSESHHNAFFVQFLPTILLWFFSCLLPWIVYFSDQFIGHWTRAAEHHQVMKKSFIFLMLMVIILPSLGLSSIHAFLEFAFSNRSLAGIRWRCIFQPDNGAFFVNYMITTALVGNALQLLRLPELCMYAVRLLAARSMSEKAAVRRANLWEFQFGQEYAWFLCMLSVAVVYSVSSPLVTPFGLLYIVGKHLVDRYNLYFAYKPSRIDKRVHTSAINYVIAAAVVLQFNTLFFNVLRTKWNRSLPVFSGTVVALSLLFFAGRLLFSWCKNFMPSQYKEFENGTTERQPMTTVAGQVFVPDVLLSRLSLANVSGQKGDDLQDPADENDDHSNEKLDNQEKDDSMWDDVRKSEGYAYD